MKPVEIDGLLLIADQLAEKHKRIELLTVKLRKLRYFLQIRTSAMWLHTGSTTYETELLQEIVAVGTAGMINITADALQRALDGLQQLPAATAGS